MNKITLTRNQIMKTEIETTGQSPETRTIIDSGGFPREMILVWSCNGDSIWLECGNTSVVCAFANYESLDSSAIWAEDLSQLAENYPGFAQVRAAVIRAARMNG